MAAIKPENPECEKCNDQTVFIQDLPGTIGVSSWYCCIKAKHSFFTYIMTLNEWIE